MLAVYGVDVLDPGVSLRRMKVLLDRLPASIRVASEPASAWTVESHLLANVFDAVQGLTYVTVKAANPKNNPPKPRPLPRPGSRAASAPQRKGSSWADILKALTGTKGVSTNGR